MRLHRFYINQSLSSEKTVRVSPEEGADQWRKVFRFVTGDQVILFCGDGYDYLAEIAGYDGDGAIVNVVERRENAITQNTLNSDGTSTARETWLFMSLVKKDTFEWITEKATELGVSHIVPILATRSEKKNVNTERLARILIEAVEQSGRATLPTLHEPSALEVSYTEHIESSASASDQCVIVFDPTGQNFKNFAASVSAQAPQKIFIFIGPEGGWSPQELDFFKTKNAAIVSMGSHILRAETAAVSALTLVGTL